MPGLGEILLPLQLGSIKGGCIDIVYAAGKTFRSALNQLGTGRTQNKETARLAVLIHQMSQQRKQLRPELYFINNDQMIRVLFQGVFGIS